MRAGGHTLTLLGSPRIYLILRSLTEGAKGQLELRRDAGLPAQSTLRGHLRTLEAAGVTTGERRGSFPGTIEYELTEAGRELFAVAESAESWLALAPDGPFELGTSPAKGAIKGLVEGWSATILSALADGPLSLTELDKRISTVSYPTIERCLQTMRLAGQLEVGNRSSKGTPYALTEWMRRALTPLAVASRWEHRHHPDGVSGVNQADIDDAVQLARPLVKLSDAVTGVCRLAVRIPDDKERRRALGYLEARDGQLSFDTSSPQAKADVSASATADTWFATMIDADTTGLRLSGDRDLAGAIFDGMRETLFSKATQR